VAVTDSTHDAEDGIHFVYRGQRYRRIGLKPHIRVDGGTTQLAIWESRCAECDEAFQFKTTARIRKLRQPNRRCRRHRRPGVRVT
jgi:hypothetical protein